MAFLVTKPVKLESEKYLCNIVGTKPLFTKTMEFKRRV